MNMNILPEEIDLNASLPKLNRRLRLGVVGGGRIAQLQAMAARLSNSWEITAGAFSSDPNKAKSAAKSWYLDEDRCYQNDAEMAEKEAKRDNGVDAVMITTPNHLHFQNAKTFIEAGIAVLCDKPMTNEIEEAEELVQLVNKNTHIFGVSYVMSCFPMIRQAKEMIAQGMIGDINQIHVEFMQDWMTQESSTNASHIKWRLDPKKSGKTSCVGDIGTHAAHLAQFVSGLTLSHVKSEFHICGAPKELEDTAFMMTRFNDKVPGSLMATRLAPGNHAGLRLRIFGSLGGIEWDLEHCDQLKCTIFGQPTQILTRGAGHGMSDRSQNFIRSGRGFPEGIIEAWANLYTEFAIDVAAAKDKRAIDQSCLLYPRIEHGRDGVKFIEAAFASNAAGGQWTAI